MVDDEKPEHRVVIQTRSGRAFETLMGDGVCAHDFVEHVEHSRDADAPALVMQLEVVHDGGEREKINFDPQEIVSIEIFFSEGKPVPEWN